MFSDGNHHRKHRQFDPALRNEVSRRPCPSTLKFFAKAPAKCRSLRGLRDFNRSGSSRIDGNISGASGLDANSDARPRAIHAAASIHVAASIDSTARVRRHSGYQDPAPHLPACPAHRDCRSPVLGLPATALTGRATATTAAALARRPDAELNLFKNPKSVLVEVRGGKKHASLAMKTSTPRPPKAVAREVVRCRRLPVKAKTDLHGSISRRCRQSGRHRFCSPLRCRIRPWPNTERR